MIRLSRYAPAKINLFLHVLGRRQDGYHEIDSVFLPLALGDRVELELWPDRDLEVTCRCPGFPALDGPENLAARAASAYLEAAGRRARVQLTIRKRIWIAAGLGGGSSDAAATLVGLQRILGGLDPARLAGLAAELGADVPYFLAPRPAHVTGVGQRVVPLKRWPALQLVLANPGSPLSTAGIYRGLGLERGQILRAAAPPLPPPAPTPEQAAALVHNDLLAPAARACPEVLDLIGIMKDLGSSGVGLSGSGPTVFGIFDSPEGCARAVEAIGGLTGQAGLHTRTTTA